MLTYAEADGCASVQENVKHESVGNSMSKLLQFMAQGQHIKLILTEKIYSESVWGL